jgi:hypothetical protein
MPIPPEEVIPQEIPSPEGNYKIINHHNYTDRFGMYCVEGAIKNIDIKAIFDIEIKIDYYDRDKKIIDSEIETAISNLKPGVARSFHIMYSGRRRGEVQYYKIYLKTLKTY